MLKNYFKIAFKVMMRQKFFTCVSLFGTSFTIMIFSISVGLFSLSYGDHAPALHRSRTLYLESLSFLSDKNSQGYIHLSLNDQLYTRLKKSPELEDLCIYRTGLVKVFRKNKVISFSVAYTDASLWNIYQYEFLEGRAYTPKDVAEGKQYAVVTESIKKFYFGEGSALGKKVGDEGKFVVIGVVRDGIVLNAIGPEAAEIFVPYHVNNVGYYESNSAILLATSKRDMPKIKEQLEKTIRKSDEYKTLKGTWVRVAAETVYEKQHFSQGSMFLGAFLFFIVVIPALNLVGLNVNRITERSSEIGIRKAFGASSNVLAGQFIVENIILTAIGGLLGILLTYFVSDFMIDVLFYDEAESVNAVSNFLMNWDTILAAIFAILFFGLLSGILPAWRMSRLHPIKALKGGSNS
ncbi:ABC transporter permease [Pedobacter sp. GR22-6]|uniref:ABC transporter permease n=1 Tax=Pedobacter sp. GR22-6 TaxID=3127957 RepID=UPI00307EE73A